MAVRLVTFATPDMSRSRALCVKSALEHGVDKAFPHEPPLELEFAKFQAASERGYGFWRWKPDLIERMLRTVCKDGDVLIYADAGVEFIAPVSHIIDRMDQDIFLFGNNWEHAHWCKRDIVDEVWPLDDNDLHYDYNDPWELFGKQCQASVVFFRVSNYSRMFVAEWLKWCLYEGGRLIDDSPSRAPNHPEFQENRHDQSILTTLAYREGIKLHWWPGVYLPNDRVYDKLDCYASDTYPPLFRHHRRRNHEFEQVA